MASSLLIIVSLALYASSEINARKYCLSALMGRQVPNANHLGVPNSGKIVKLVRLEFVMNQLPEL